MNGDMVCPMLGRKLKDWSSSTTHPLVLHKYDGGKLLVGDG
jgi:hypothetical protein